MISLINLCSLVYFLTIGNVLGLLRCLSKVKASDLNNYRPISVISVIAKVFERIVYDQLYNFLSDEDIISTHQSGFRSLHSTVTALLEATDNWAFNIDRGNVNAVVFLDLKKAFDTVDHDILSSKMNLNGIQGIALDWFGSYLTNRTQQCLVNGSLSRICSLKNGVPQGTILAPLLFLILFYFVVFLGQAKYSYFSADFRLKIFLYYSLVIASDFAILECIGV